MLARILPLLLLAASLTPAQADPLDRIGPSKFLPIGPTGITPRPDQRNSLGILPVGGNYKQVASLNQQTIYAREATTGWWKSSNYGLTWRREPQIPLGSLSIDPALNTRLFLVDETARIVRRSTDEGKTWNIVINDSNQGNNTPKNSSADLQFADPGVVYFRKSALPNPGIYVSTNGGANWTLRQDPQLPDSSPPFTVGRSPFNSRRLYTIRYQSVRYSDNDGQTWHTNGADLPILDPIFQSGFFLSSFLDKGFGASPTVPGRLYANVELNYEVIESFGVSYIIQYDRVMQSHDYGLHWTVLPPYAAQNPDEPPAGNGSQGNHFFTVASQTIDSTVRDAIYIGTGRVVQIVPSLGEVNFLDIADFSSNGELAITPRNAVSISLNQKNVASFFTSTPAGIFRGTWSGPDVNWNTYNPRIPIHPVRTLADVAFSMSNLVRGNYVSVGANGTWQRLPQQFSEDMIAIRHPSTPNLMFACENVQVYKSLNSGQSWTSVSPPLSGPAGPYFFTSLRAADNNPDRLYGIAYLNVFPPAAYLLQYQISTNQWTPIAGPADGSYYRAHVAAPAGSNPGMFYAVFYNLQNKAEVTFKRNDDDELHRSIPPMTRVDAILPDPANPNRLFLIGGTQQMWADFTNVSNPTYTPVLASAPAGIAQLLAIDSAWALLARDAQGQTTLYLSENQGLTWTDIGSSSAFPVGYSLDLRWDAPLAQLVVAHPLTGIWSAPVARPGVVRLPGSIAPTGLKIAGGAPADAAHRDAQTVSYTPISGSLTSFSLDNVATSPVAAPSQIRLRARVHLEYPAMSTSIALYNYNKSKFDTFSTAPGSATGADFTITPPNPAHYLHPTSRQLRARLTLTPHTSAPPTWRAPLDHFAWEITP